MDGQFGLALIVAAITYLLTLALGEEFGALLYSVGFAMIIIPLLFYFLVGLSGMVNADAHTTQILADSTNAKMITYVSNQLPGIVFADIAAAVVGVVAGFITKIALLVS